MSVVLLIAIAGVVLLGFRLTPQDHGSNRPALTCYTIVLTSFAIYVFFSGLLIAVNGGQFEWATRFQSSTAYSRTLAIGLLALIAYLVTYQVSELASKRRRGDISGRRQHVRSPAEVDTGTALRQRDLNTTRFAQLLIVLGVLLKLYALSRGGGVDTSLIRASNGARLSSQISPVTNLTNTIRTLSTCADAAAAWLVVLALRYRRRTLPPLVTLFTVLALSYIGLGKRLILLLPLVVVAVAFHRYRRPVTLRVLPVGLVMVLLVGMGSLFFRIYVPAALTNSRIDLNQIQYAQGSIVRFYFYSLEFSSVEMMTTAVSDREYILRSLGGTSDAIVRTNIEPLGYSIPRALWPGKPTQFTDVSYAVAADLNGVSVNDAQAGYATTLVGTSYIFGGLGGVVLLFAIFAVASRAVDGRCRRQLTSTSGVVWYALAMTAAFYYFRQGTVGWVFVITVVQQLGAILAFGVLGIAARPRRKSASLSPRLSSARSIL